MSQKAKAWRTAVAKVGLVALSAIWLYYVLFSSRAADPVPAADKPVATAPAPKSSPIVVRKVDTLDWPVTISSTPPIQIAAEDLEVLRRLNVKIDAPKEVPKAAPAPKPAAPAPAKPKPRKVAAPPSKTALDEFVEHVTPTRAWVPTPNFGWPH